MSDNLLESSMREVLTVINPLREDWDTRIMIINEFKNVVESLEIMRGAIVEPFGSFVSNLFTRWGDLDISIELPTGTHIASAGKKRKQTLLSELHKALKQKGGVRKVQFIPNARVPILKFESKYRNISCDISIDNMAGLMKSRFMFWINTIDGRFRDLVLLVKEWAKAHNINNPKSGTFNSYSLSLLVIFHFQTCSPPIFPSLQELYPGNLADHLQGVRSNVEKDIAETCMGNIAKFKAQIRKRNQSSLSQLFVSFIMKFSDLHLKASELGVCTATGKWERIATITRWLPNNHALFIEDPFEQPENSARAVSTKQFEKIATAFASTYHRLLSTNDKYSIVTTLSRPQTSHSIVRPPAPIRQLYYNGKQPQQFRPQQQVHQGKQFPLQAQQQLYRSQNKSRPNTSVLQRPPFQQHVQQQNGQVQQMWRPKNDKADS